MHLLRRLRCGQAVWVLAHPCRRSPHGPHGGTVELYAGTASRILARRIFNKAPDRGLALNSMRFCHRS